MAQLATQAVTQVIVVTQGAHQQRSQRVSRMQHRPNLDQLAATGVRFTDAWCQSPIFRAVRDQRYRLTIEANSNTACELFDLQDDPHELHNRVSAPQLQPVQEALTEKLRHCL